MLPQVGKMRWKGCLVKIETRTAHENETILGVNPLFSDLSAFFLPQPMQDFNKAVFSFVLGENT